MKPIRKTLPLIFLSIISGNALSQKEYDYASAGQAKTLVNPAFTGNNEGLIQDVYSLNNFQKPYQAFQNYLLVDLPILRAKDARNGGLSIGHTNFNYNRGMAVSRQTDLSYSYAIRLGRWGLTPAIQVSHLYRGFDMNKMSFQQALPYGYSLNNSGPKLSKQNVSFSGGVIFNLGDKFTIGAAFYDINNPNIGLMNDISTGIRHSYHASGLIKAGELIDLQPYAHVRIGGLLMEEYADAGLFTRLKFFTLQTAIRVAEYDYYGIVGGSFYFPGFKFGYTANINTYYTHFLTQEVFLAVNFSKLTHRDKVPFRSMMINVGD